MLEGFRQRLSDRRGKYSLKKHIGRLRREGRLGQVGLAAVALLTVGGIAFARCEGSSITGPSAPTAQSTASGSVATSTVGSVSTAGMPLFKDNETVRPFTFIGRNPCNGDAVVASGKRHIVVTNRLTPSGDFQTDEHINDSFKSVVVVPEGEVADPETEYVGSDIHTHRMTVDATDLGMTHRDLTNEHLSRRGGGDHWVLHLDQRTEISADGEPVNVVIKGHASCPDKTKCTLPGDCPDEAFTLVP